MCENCVWYISCPFADEDGLECENFESVDFIEE